MKERKEIKVLWDILDRLNEKFPNFTSFALGDFCSDYGLDEEELKKKYVNQIFLGWVFLEYLIYDGKKVLSLARQILDLSFDEEKMLSNVENSVVGYFSFVFKKEDVLTFEDLMTGKKYNVKVVDLDYKFKKGDIIKAQITKNFDDELFFFGGFALVKDKKEIVKDIEMYKNG